MSDGALCFGCVPWSFFGASMQPPNGSLSPIEFPPMPSGSSLIGSSSAPSSTRRMRSMEENAPDHVPEVRAKYRSMSSPAVIPQDAHSIMLENEMIAEDMRYEHYESKVRAMHKLISSSANQNIGSLMLFSESERNPLDNAQKDDNEGDDDLFSMDGDDDAEFHFSPSSVIYSGSNTSRS